MVLLLQLKTGSRTMSHFQCGLCRDFHLCLHEKWITHAQDVCYNTADTWKLQFYPPAMLKPSPQSLGCIVQTATYRNLFYKNKINALTVTGSVCVLLNIWVYFLQFKGGSVSGTGENCLKSCSGIRKNIFSFIIHIKVTVSKYQMQTLS